MPAAPYCSLAHALRNGGIVNRTAGTLGSQVQYFCKPGYRLVGSSNATCRRNPVGVYQWDALTPVCQGEWWPAPLRREFRASFLLCDTVTVLKP